MDRNSSSPASAIPSDVASWIWIAENTVSNFLLQLKLHKMFLDGAIFPFLWIEDAACEGIHT